VVEAPLERGDGDASNGGRIMIIRLFLMVWWSVENWSGKNINFFFFFFFFVLRLLFLSFAHNNVGVAVVFWYCWKEGIETRRMVVESLSLEVY
jgi:hypothetical protein